MRLKLLFCPRSTSLILVFMGHFFKTTSTNGNEMTDSRHIIHLSKACFGGFFLLESIQNRFMGTVFLEIVPIHNRIILCW